MAKGKPVRKGAPVLNDDIAQLIFVRDRASEKGALDIFININPNASTIRYDYDPATGKLIDAMGNPLPFEALLILDKIQEHYLRFLFKELKFLTITMLH